MTEPKSPALAGQRMNVTISLPPEKMHALTLVASHWEQSVDDVVSDILNRALVVHVDVKVRV